MNTSTEASTDHAPSRRMRWLWIVLAVLILLAVVGLLGSTEDTVDVSKSKAPPRPPLVSTETVLVGSETIEVSAFAEVRPRWSAELRAAISGRVTSVLNSALAGELVAAGDTLLTIENSRYMAQKAEAELALKQADLALWQAKNANIVARKDYQRSGRRAPNELALKLPQLDIAQSAVVSARARLITAERQLNDATVVAPFAGFVTERFVSPGQSVSIGDRLVKLVDSTTYELDLQLSRASWDLIQKPISGLSAKVTDHKGKIIARASIRQGGGFLDETTRQYKVFLHISGKEARNVLSGDFVRVLLPGTTVAAGLNVPASALTQEGHVWYVDDEDRLQRMTPRILFRRQDRAVIAAPTGQDSWRIAVTPLASFLPGKRVHARTGGG
ncbi:MAG: efflux RND transporter periplasmic adaptor subunit [Pseudomonadota bacterium]